VERNVEYDGSTPLVYPDWKITGAETGRMSCSNPNMQNIPVRNMPVFRRLFRSRHKGGSMVVADFAQQEPRIMAHLSDDKNLKEALNSEPPRDLHQETTDIFQLGDRRKGKDINLGLGYGMTPHGLASRVGISLQEAERGIMERNRRYPEVAMWMSSQKTRAHSVGYVMTTTGRRVWINPYTDQWEKNAVNGPVQGSAADQTKHWSGGVHREIEDYPVCLIIHDEVVADCESGTVVDTKRTLKHVAKASQEFVVPGMPMPIDTHTGDSWGAKQDEDEEGHEG
jgi:DNA polymerase-1